MANQQKGNGGIFATIVVVGITLGIAGIGAVWNLRGKIDAVDKDESTRAIQISAQLKLIEGFLREKYPEFSNFVKKESLSRLVKEVSPFVVVPPGAQQSSGTLNPQSDVHSIALETNADQNENLQVPSGVEVWMYIPTLRRVRLISGAAASGILIAAIRNGSPAVVVYGRSDRKVKRIYLPNYPG